MLLKLKFGSIISIRGRLQRKEADGILMSKGHCILKIVEQCINRDYA
jgi:hypothetical protein